MKLYNKRAKYDYQLKGERVEAGVSLLGIEAKTLREGRGDISSSFVKLIGNELYLVNATIPSNLPGYVPTRTRKLLLHRKEILSLTTKASQQKLQIVPVLVYNKGRLIKVLLDLGKPKRKFEKRDSIKKRDIERELSGRI